jgi:hypothetical protein
MSKFLGKVINEELLGRLSGKDIGSKEGKAIIVVTVDEQGWAHPAVFSYYEIVAKSEGQIDIAVGKTSTTGKNLRRTGKITLLVTDAGINYYIKGGAQETRESLGAVPFMSLFRVEVAQLLEDQEPGSPITSGLTFIRPEKTESREVSEKVFQAVREEPL